VGLSCQTLGAVEPMHHSFIRWFEIAPILVFIGGWFVVFILLVLLGITLQEVKVQSTSRL